MSIILKPCPFCCGEALIKTTNLQAAGASADFYTIACLECNAEIFRYFKTLEEAAEAWNRRATDEH